MENWVQYPNLRIIVAGGDGTVVCRPEFLPSHLFQVLGVIYSRQAACRVPTSGKPVLFFFGLTGVDFYIAFGYRK
jgi:hypothetical protein